MSWKNIYPDNIPSKNKRFELKMYPKATKHMESFPTFLLCLVEKRKERGFMLYRAKNSLKYGLWGPDMV